MKIVASDDFGWACRRRRRCATRRSPPRCGVFGSHYVCGYRSAADQLPELRQRHLLRQAAVGQRERLRRLQRRRAGPGPRHQPRLHRREDDRVHQLAGHRRHHAEHPWATTGVAVAPQPWSGSYSIGKNTWVMAQTTQFTAPGWRYLDASSGYIGGNRNNGSYVSLKSTNNSDYSTIIETHGRRLAPRRSNFTVTGGLSTGTVHVWSTNVRSNNPRRLLRPRRRHHAVRRHASADRPARLRLQHHHHDRAGQGHGDQPRPGHPGPAVQRQLRQLRHRRRSQVPDGPAGLVRDRRAAAAAAPASACARCPRRRRSTGRRQAEPYALLGDLSWRNYTVSSDVLLEKSGYAELIGRGNTYNHQGPQNLNAYYLRVTDSGAWSILSNNTSGNWRTLASGNVAALGTGRWHTLSLTLHRQHHHRGHRRHHRRHRERTPPGRPARSATRTGQGVTAQFDNLSITPAAAAPAVRPESARRGSDRCLDVNGASQTDGTRSCRSGTATAAPTSSGPRRHEQPAARCTATSASTSRAPRPAAARGS